MLESLQPRAARVHDRTFNTQNTVYFPLLLLFVCESNAERWKNTTEFNVAIIVSGAIRSFMFTFESWSRYIIKPWKRNIHIFAHIIQDNDECQLFQKGLTMLKEIATTVEVGSRVPFMPLDYIRDSLPVEYKKFLNQKRSGHGPNTNSKYVDMNFRRSRAYELALAYQDATNLQYHALLFLRPDTAFYAPELPLFEWYQNLQYLESNYQRPGLVIPMECNFHGLCDRHIFGLSHTIKTYAKHEWIFDVLHWSLQKHPYDQSNFRYNYTGKNVHLWQKPIKYSRYDIVAANHSHSLHVESAGIDYTGITKPGMNGPSVFVNQWFRQHTTYNDIKSTLKKLKGFRSMEFIHLAWLVMNNWTQVSLFPRSNFVTLRLSYAESYCSHNRREFVSRLKQTPLKSTVYDEKYTMSTDIDMISVPMIRCGENYLSANFTRLQLVCHDRK